ncbi:hypothetical protein V6N11_074003 [Hibiscus sabdariffa]|uniref:Uncharacterized protein n=1 Tax=Hibiscus sabdariffa TaxID=183260 RepID=A0ABR2P578_9ROSI
MIMMFISGSCGVFKIGEVASRDLGLVFQLSNNEKPVSCSWVLAHCNSLNEINGVVAALMEVGSSTIADEMFIFDYCLGKEMTPRAI